MSTRQTIYYHQADDLTPGIHVYREMMDGEVRMEISLLYAEINIPLPKDLLERMGIKE
jgi:hypothetical protein